MAPFVSSSNNTTAALSHPPWAGCTFSFFFRESKSPDVFEPLSLLSSSVLSPSLYFPPSLTLLYFPLSLPFYFLLSPFRRNFLLLSKIRRVWNLKTLKNTQKQGTLTLLFDCSLQEMKKNGERRGNEEKRREEEVTVIVWKELWREEEGPWTRIASSPFQWIFSSVMRGLFESGCKIEKNEKKARIEKNERKKN